MEKRYNELLFGSSVFDAKLVVFSDCRIGIDFFDLFLIIESHKFCSVLEFENEFKWGMIAFDAELERSGLSCFID